MVVTRFDATNQPRLFRFWPQTGQLKELPIIVPRFAQSTRAFPDGKSLVVFGQLTTEGAPSGFHLYALNLESGVARRLVTGPDEKTGVAAAVAPDGASVIASVVAGHLTRIVRIEADGSRPPRTLFTVTGTVWSIEVGRDSSIYLDQMLAPLKIWRFGTSGGRGELLASIESTGECCGAVGVLRDGRLLLSGIPGGRYRLLIAEPGRDPRALLTSEESSAPIATVGPDAIAFVAGSRNDWTIAIASTTTGRINSRIKFDKAGLIESLSASPDGQTLYVGGGGTIWAQPLNGGAPRAIRAGSAAAAMPDGRRLLVQVVGTPTTRLFEVVLEGGAEREIVLKGPYALTFDGVTSGAITHDGRQLLATLASLDNWYFQPGIIDLATGAVRAIPVDEFADYHFVMWGADEKSIVAGGPPTRYVMWRFQADKP